MRDARSREQLTGQGWRVLEVWECVMKRPERLHPEQVIEIAIL